MVRHKIRWLLVRIDIDGKEELDKKELSRSIRYNLDVVGGVAATAATVDTHGMLFCFCMWLTCGVFVNPSYTRFSTFLGRGDSLSFDSGTTRPL
jgi:hypothetical protein